MTAGTVQWHKARFTDSEPDEPEWKAVHRVADRNLSRVAAAYAGSLYVLRRDVDPEEVEFALSRNDVGMAVAAFPWDVWARTFDRLATERLAETMRQAGEAVGRQTRRVQKVEGTLQGVFDILNPRAARIAAQIAADMVTRVTEATKWAIRQVIVDAQASGISLREQAKSITRILIEQAGLDAPRARRLERYRLTLEERGTSARALERMVGQRRDQLLQARARTIARHETMDASVAGQVEVWSQAQEQGLLPAVLTLEWIDTEDRRTCPVCTALGGQRARKGEQFHSSAERGGNGRSYERPPAHILCRCALSLVDPLDEE